MWNDNESRIDLLGFDFLVDSLEILLTERALLPLTVGVIGDWGSGKSSLMTMAAKRLQERDNAHQFITIEFNPWRFEDFAQVKLALMAAVIDAIEDHLAEHAPDETRREIVTRKVKRLRSFISRLGIAKLSGTAGAAAVGLGLEEAAVIGNVAQTLAGPLAEADDGQVGEPAPLLESVADFHAEFEDLVKALGEEFQALVVFIDDMDRCATDTIVATFETIRLFLNAPKTAYVVGAHEAIITAALEGRYPARTEGDDKIGRHYLEKMLQASVHVPPLSEPEALTYISLLYAERHLGRESDAFARLANAAAEHRVANELEVAMNVGIASTTLGDAMPDELASSLAMSEQIGPPLAQGLRGNPRQIKRFLNTLQLRLRVSEKRGLALDADKLAKLMVLETSELEAFERIFHWQIEQAGIPKQLIDAEAYVRSGTAVDKETQDWALSAAVKPWLEMDPPLAGIALGPYFTFSRDRMRRVARASRLTPELQKVFTGLRSDLESRRKAAVTAALALDPLALADLMSVALDLVESDLGGKGTRSLIEIAKTSGRTAEALMKKLKSVQGRRVPQSLVTALKATLSDRPELIDIFSQWDRTAPAGVKRAMKLKKQS